MMCPLWQECRDYLKNVLTYKHFNTWILPVQGKVQGDVLALYTPNQFVYEWIVENALAHVETFLSEHVISSGIKRAHLSVGSLPEPTVVKDEIRAQIELNTPEITPIPPKKTIFDRDRRSILNDQFTFDNFIEGKSNQIARAAAIQVSEHPGESLNPLFIYGGVGLGKTHLMHAVGNLIISKHPGAQILYLHSERYVSDMVKSLQSNAMEDFKRYYRSLNVLMIDDIQFFAGKDRSQEEFFHTFNALVENKQQIILTCDRYPKEIEGLEERLKSRFGWGLTVSIDPPELETRVAILVSKAEHMGVVLPHEVAFFIGKRIRSNVRELEGALKRVIAHANFVGAPITVEFAKEALRDLIAMQDRLVTIGNIQKVVADYFKVKLTDLLSDRRHRAIARPRQIAMALSKELTTHSLPEIGQAFGGRDHTTVMHACKQITKLRSENGAFDEDYKHLVRILTN